MMAAADTFETFALDEHGTYHGCADASCGWERAQVFVCWSCKRTVCYCGGHSGYHDACPLCDECCTSTHEHADPRLWDCEQCGAARRRAPYVVKGGRFCDGECANAAGWASAPPANTTPHADRGPGYTHHGTPASCGCADTPATRGEE